MKVLPIVWQRLVTADGETCERCGNTYLEMVHAVEILKQELHPLGIEPVLRTKTMSENEFKAHPEESNRIWIGNKTLEEWLDAKAGESQCCAACGDANCRTLQLDAVEYEVVPQQLILKAALKAAAML
nr:DUF2703 domain-containing protein [uncultured Tolumonas sp.]